MKSLFKKSMLGLIVLGASSLLNMSYAEAGITPKLACFLTDQMSSNQKPGDPKDTFITSSPMIYAICSTSDLQKNQALKAVWVAENTHKIAPDNYKIQEKAVSVPSQAQIGQELTFDFGLSKPKKDWPAGTYRVDFYVDNQSAPAESINFTLSANNTTE